MNDNTGSSNVVRLDCVTSVDLPPDRILTAAMNQLETAIVIGYDKDGQEYFASSVADGGSVLWLLERLKMQLLSGPEESN